MFDAVQNTQDKNDFLPFYTIKNNVSVNLYYIYIH